MLTITVPGVEVYNEEVQEFQTYDDFEMQLEHSLVSLSKWESKFKKAFLSPGDKSQEEVLGYIEAMIVTPENPPGKISRLSKENFADINAYIESKESATTFADMNETNSGKRGETITSELIYFWMVTFSIPLECENWHLNRLFALIKICNLKNNPPKKVSSGEAARQRADMNAKRRAELGTSG